MSIESFLTNIRLSIIGDDEIKQLVIESSHFKEIYELLDEIIITPNTDQIHLDLLNKMLIIFNSLTYYSTKLLNDNNTANKLIAVAIKYQDDDKLLNNTFKCLMNLTSKSSTNVSINLENDIGEDFNRLLASKLSEFDPTPRYRNSLYLQIFKLLPHLNPSDIKSLLPTLLKLLRNILQNPKEILVAKYKNSDIYLNCFENQSIPSMLPIDNFPVLLPPLLYSISHLISHEKAQDLSSVFNNQSSNLKDEPSIDRLVDRDLYFTLSSLLKSNNHDLKLASITVLVNFSLYSSLSKSKKVSNVKKILPVLIQLTDSFEKSNETLASFKSEYKHSKNFNPFFILSKLCLEFEFVHEFLINCNIIKKILDFLKIINKNNIENVSIDKLDNLIDFFLILSSITSENENNRKLIVNDDLIQVIEKILQNHFKILYTEILKNKNENSFELLSVSNHLSLAAVYLLRSLSRSVAILRTSLYETDLVQSLLHLININEFESESELRSLIINDSCCASVVINDEVLLKSVILSILSNFVLDFSPLRSLLLVDNDLISVIADVLLNTKHSILIRNSLWCFRHILFNEKPDKKDEYLKKISLDQIFKFILDNESDELIQEEAFNVLRNLTCDSKKHVALTLNYKSTPDFDFFELLNTILKNSLKRDVINNGLLESIAYVIVHMAGIDEKTRDLIISKREILYRLKEIIESNKVKFDVKLGCIWVLINLTWIENTTVRNEEIDDEPVNEELFYDEQTFQDSNNDEAMTDDDHGISRQSTRGLRFDSQQAKHRIEILKELGFVDVLIKLIDSNNNVDLKERVKTCLFNLNRFT